MTDFWARRKAAVAKEAEAERAALAASEAAEREQALAERTDAEILEEAQLPEPEALDSAEAVREFLASAVPQRLKTRALRQLWKLNPVLANLDGLIDYGEDFTDSATVIENLQTAYQVGQGMLKHIEALAQDTPDEQDTPNPDMIAEPEPEDIPVAHTEPEPAPADPVEEIAAADPEMPLPPEAEEFPRPCRRMQFHFEEHA